MEEVQIPKHIAIIPDGNRRWGKAHGIVPHEGIAEGSKRFYDITKAAFEAGSSHVTFWAASEDNFVKRGPLEVRFMIELLKQEGRNGGFLEELKKNEISIRFIGKWREILNDSGVEDVIDRFEGETAHFVSRRVTLLYGYDGRREMLEAIKILRKSSNQELTYEDVYKALWTHDLPPVDLVIRTGGEPHWSAGFMMWLTADSQLYFTDLLWPDFTSAEFRKALDDFASRGRRYGK